MKYTRKLVLLALFVSQSLILSIIENWLPIPSVVPGVKLGLANIVTMIVIIFMGTRDALLVVTVRCLLASIFTGGPIVLLFSIAGGILSTLVMSALYRGFGKSLSIAGISVAGAVAHNIGQLSVASLLMKDTAVFGYLPVLLVAGIIMGLFIGICSSFLAAALKKTKIFN